MIVFLQRALVIALLIFVSAVQAAPKKAPKKPATPETQSAVKPAPPPPPVIVIDPGHGGKDPGAISKAKIREKDVVLAISKKLSQALKKKIGAKIFFTRAGDQFVSLDYRNRFANQKQCDLFLSVHANASPNKKAEGLEIYYLNRATDSASQKLAARENAGAPKEEKEIEGILSDLIQAAVTEESAELAAHVQRSLRQRVMKRHKIKEVEVKTALFYVLVGAKCPSLLIETGFITNREEGKRLKSPAFQRALADAIADGVSSYLVGLEHPKGDL